MIKAVFFDVDGTLVDFGSVELSPKTKEALLALQEKGILIFIATGRPPYVVHNYEGVTFDGLLTFNGSYCFNKKETIYKNPMNQEDVQKIIQNAKELGHGSQVAGLDRVSLNFYDEVLDEYARIARQEIVPDSEFETYSKGDIFQMMIAITPDQDNDLLKGCSHSQITRWWDRAVDVIPAGGGKGTAIEKVMEYYHLKKDELMAFGDGGNDIDMLKAVGCSIAMGNATDSVKEVATFVTKPVWEDGIWHALKHFQLID